MRLGLRNTLLAAAWAAALLAAPEIASAETPKHLAPIPAQTVALMTARSTTTTAPILMRAFKKEAEIEVWKRARDGRYVHLKTYPVCRWSGQLGPKQRQGDRQTPEGFYAVTPKQLNPNSAYYLSFDLGYPNAYDRAHKGSGAYLMVHGTCSSAGCFAMTDKQIAELYALAREAFAGGQRAFQFQSYPFRMTAENMARHRTDPHIGFWRQLKEGYDRFEATGEEPVVGVAAGRYVFAPSPDPTKEARVAARRAEEEARVAALVEQGVAAVRTTYADGGQHASYASLMRQGGAQLGDVSRPEALAWAGREIVVIPARKRATQMAEVLPPPRPAEPAAVAASPGLRPADLFGPRLVGDAPAQPMRAQPMIAGAERILPSTLASLSVELASWR